MMQLRCFPQRELLGLGRWWAELNCYKQLSMASIVLTLYNCAALNFKLWIVGWKWSIPGITFHQLPLGRKGPMLLRNFSVLHADVNRHFNKEESHLHCTEERAKFVCFPHCKPKKIKTVHCFPRSERQSHRNGNSLCAKINPAFSSQINKPSWKVEWERSSPTQPWLLQPKSNWRSGYYLRNTMTFTKEKKKWKLSSDRYFLIS